MPKKVLIAIDWSEYAEKAFDWYVYHLHRKGAKLVLSHYIEADKEKELRKKEAELVELQEAYENRLIQMKIDYEWIVGTGGGPGEHLVNVSREQNVDMIVMGARGLGKLSKMILGSVSDYVLRKAKVPVLICRKGTTGSIPETLTGEPLK